MSRKVDERIGAELARAEAEGSCLVPATRADRAALMRRVRRRRTADEDRIISPAPGIYARWAHWRSLKPPQRALGIIRGLSALHPDWVFCGPSAALVRGISVSWASLRRTHVVCGPRDGKRLAARIVRHQIDPGDVEVVSGVRVTSLARTAFDCMRDASFPDALAVADSVLRLSGMSRGALRRLLRRSFSGHRGIARTLATCDWADPRAENGGESVARAIMIERGVALPTIQVRLADPLEEDGWFRIDFTWLGEDGRPVAGELDGLVKYVDPAFMGGLDLMAVISGERRREARITAYDMRVARFSLGEVENEASFWRWVRLYGIPFGPPPERRHGVPVRALAGGWSPSCGAGEMSLGGWRLEYQVVAA